MLRADLCSAWDTIESEYSILTIDANPVTAERYLPDGYPPDHVPPNFVGGNGKTAIYAPLRGRHPG